MTSFSQSLYKQPDVKMLGYILLVTCVLRKEIVDIIPECTQT